jgi:hypothetical protein
MEQELANLYSSRVQPRGTVRSSGIGGSTPATFERDPYFSNLEHNVFSQISELVKDEPVAQLPEYKSNQLKQFSVEDAIKELLELEKH